MAPDFSPWRKIDWSETLAPGFQMVATPSHGGIMVSRDASFMLSPAARKCGAWNGGYLCFEFGMGQGDGICRILEENGYTVLERTKDYNDRERALIARFGRKED